MTTPTGTNPNRFRYTGHEWDSETGLYYYRARYYDPQVGRFISEDPIRFRGGQNFYRYVRNNSVNKTDPFGLFPGGCIDCIISMVQCMLDSQKCRKKMDQQNPSDIEVCETASQIVGHQVGSPDDAYYLVCFNGQPNCKKMLSSCTRCGITPPFGMTTPKLSSNTPSYGPSSGPRTPTSYPPDFPGRPPDDPINDPFAVPK